MQLQDDYASFEPRSPRAGSQPHQAVISGGSLGPLPYPPTGPAEGWQGAGWGQLHVQGSNQQGKRSAADPTEVKQLRAQFELLLAQSRADAAVVSSLRAQLVAAQAALEAARAELAAARESSTQQGASRQRMLWRSCLGLGATKP